RALIAHAGTLWRSDDADGADGADGRDRGDGDRLRADWRFLTPGAGRSHILIVERAETGLRSSSWQWLVDDGWTDQVSRRNGSGPGPEIERDEAGRPDVVVVKAGASLDAGLAEAPDHATLIIELAKGWPALLWPARAKAAAAGFDAARLYLVTPGLDSPRRFTPLHRTEGLRWLLGPPPGESTSKIRSLAIDLGGRLLRSRLGPMFGDLLLVATADRRPSGESMTTIPADCGDSVLMTSGHDEGSRAVLVPLTDDGAEPHEVVKIASRPAFNRNIDLEVEMIRSLRAEVDGSTPRPPNGGHRVVDHLPRVLETFDVGPLRASREAYAGRWTASDLGFRRPKTRADILNRVLDATTELALATHRSTEPWSAELFDRYLRHPFGRYVDADGWSAPLVDLLADLEQRSDEVLGRPMPLIGRHYDLGPWNVVFGSDDRLTIIDWELAPPRSADDDGLAGADHLYFAKYWLHIWLGTESVEDELSAFEFLAEAGPGVDHRATVATALADHFDSLGIDHGLVPLIACHTWIEKALYAGARNGAAEPDRANRYLEGLAEHRQLLFDHWPIVPVGGEAEPAGPER
ncbi:MAG: hypothetical protein ACR2QK_19865, partial [Acidimicrobiales bacterium]